MAVIVMAVFAMPLVRVAVDWRQDGSGMGRIGDDALDAPDGHGGCSQRNDAAGDDQRGDRIDQEAEGRFEEIKQTADAFGKISISFSTSPLVPSPSIWENALWISSILAFVALMEPSKTT